MSVLVLGAGMAGLAAARQLVAAGHDVKLVDKGRSVGGRLATRRIGAATLDHGAQFFTVRTEEFSDAVGEAEEAGIVREWCRGFDSVGDGHPRYAVDGGMNRLAKHLAVGLDIALDTAVSSVAIEHGQWALRHADGVFTADALVLTAPVPQSLHLLDNGHVALAEQLRARLDDVTYEPTLALLVVLDRPSAIPPPGGRQLTEGPFSFVADNQAKGISSLPAVTLHANHRLSVDRWNDDPDDVRTDLLAAAAGWLGDAGIVEAQLKKWRYAQPVAPAEAECEATEIDGLPLVFAGDAFAGAKVEGAFRSGRAAASYMLNRLNRPR